MLKKILEDGFVPDDILVNISDEDKQLIFLEIRKEQLRKYKLRQEIDEKSEDFRHEPNKRGKNVRFPDEDLLVCYLGEREGDKPIEKILEEEVLKKAQKEAERQILKEYNSPKETVINKIETINIETVPRIEITAQEPTIEEESKLKVDPPEIPSKTINTRSSKTAEQKRQEMFKRKSTELYNTYISQIHELEISAEKEDEELTKLWEKSEEQARLDEEQRRKMAEEARKFHAHINSDLIEDSNTFDTKKNRPPLPSKKSEHLRFVINAIQKSNLSKSKADIKSWFLEREWNRMRVFDGKTDTVPEWFHGMISRENTEQLLETKDFGTFIIRLSDKFQCYVLSYKSKSKVKHILIESKPDSQLYQFFGTVNVQTFASLMELIQFFQGRPLSDSNGDILTKPCGQEPGQFVDYIRILLPDCVDSKPATITCSL